MSSMSLADLSCIKRPYRFICRFDEVGIAKRLVGHEIDTALEQILEGLKQSEILIAARYAVQSFKPHEEVEITLGWIELSGYGRAEDIQLSNAEAAAKYGDIRLMLFDKGQQLLGLTLIHRL